MPRNELGLDTNRHFPSKEDIESQLEYLSRIMPNAFDEILDDVPRSVFHYTSLDTLCKIMESGLNRHRESFKFQYWRGGNLSTQNDPTEGSQSTELDAILQDLFLADLAKHSSWNWNAKKDLDLVTDLKKQIQSIFTISFSELGDSIDLWTRYGDDGNGVSIEIDATELLSYSKSNPNIGFFKCFYKMNGAAEMLYRVLLKNEKQLLTWHKSSGDRVANSHEAAMLAKLYGVQGLLPFCKSEHYQSEHEWRLAFRNESDNQQWHLNFTNRLLRKSLDFELLVPSCIVKSITLGPRSSNDYNVRQLESWLQMFPLCKDVLIKKSTVPYC